MGCRLQFWRLGAPVPLLPLSQPLPLLRRGGCACPLLVRDAPETGVRVHYAALLITVIKKTAGRVCGVNVISPR